MTDSPQWRSNSGGAWCKSDDTALSPEDDFTDCRRIEAENEERHGDCTPVSCEVLSTNAWAELVQVINDCGSHNTNESWCRPTLTQCLKKTRKGSLHFGDDFSYCSNFLRISWTITRGQKTPIDDKGLRQETRKFRYGDYALDWHIWGHSQITSSPWGEGGRLELDDDLMTRGRGCFAKYDVIM